MMNESYYFESVKYILGLFRCNDVFIVGVFLPNNGLITENLYHMVAKEQRNYSKCWKRYGGIVIYGRM